MQALDVLFALLAGLSSTSAAAPEIITVDHHFSAVACAGYCTNSHLVVRSDGLAELRVESLTGKDVERRRYRITRQEFAEFRRVYSAIRPAGLKGPIGTCDEETLVIDWDIRWNGPDASSRLLACRDVDAVRKAYFDGYRVLRISPATAQRLSAKEAELPR
jgi:hypothetical protein